MKQFQDFSKISPIVILALIIAWTWIGFAFTMGTESQSMFSHPIVPIILLVLIVGLKSVNSLKRAIIITVILISIWLFVKLQNVFMPFIIGIILAYLVHVCLDGLQNIWLPWFRLIKSEENENLSLPKKILAFLKSIRVYKHDIYLKRSIAAILLVLIIFGGITLIFFSIVPQIVQQSIHMKDGISEFYTNIVKPNAEKLYKNFQNGKYPAFVESLPEFARDAIKDMVAKANTYITERIPSLANTTRQILTKIFQRLYSGIAGTIGQISSAFFIIIIFIYAVQGFHQRLNKFNRLFPEKYQEYITRYAVEIDTNMRAFLRGQLTVIIVVSILSIIVYSIIGVPFALVVGILAGICNFIPNLGPVLGGIIAIFSLIVGLAAREYELASFFIRSIFTIAGVFGIQLIDNSLISPRVMSSAIEVEPLTVMFAVLLFASLVGIVGALLAIPAIVIIKSIVKVSQEIKLEQPIPG